MSVNLDNMSYEVTAITPNKYSEWQCQLFGSSPGSGITWRPHENEEPNWFWRKMQFLCFGHRWSKVK